jgi:hypothetical protein
VFFTYICKHLQNIDLLISYTNIKQISDALSLVILKVNKYNLAQVLSQFYGMYKRPCKVCHSLEHFDNQCLNKAIHQQQIDEYTYFPRHINQLTTISMQISPIHMSTIPTLHGYIILKQNNTIIELFLIYAKSVNTYTDTLNIPTS